MEKVKVCYLLRSCSEVHSNQTYIGCTQDIQKRLRQHNGLEAGGAYETRVARPWEIVAVVHGFPSNQELAEDSDRELAEDSDRELAFQFESAWQNPGKSTCIRDSIGDQEAGALAKRLGRELSGPRGDLAVLKCLLNECPDFPKSQLGLSVEFSSETWRKEFLQANYIFGGDDGGDGDDHDLIVPCIAPSFVNQSLVKEPNNFKWLHPFRWEILDKVDLTSGELNHDMWRQLGSISKAIKRADKNEPFKDDRRNSVLLAPEYELLNRLSEYGELNSFVVAFERAIKCFAQEENAHKRLIEVASQFDYGTKFKAYFEKKTKGRTDVDIERIANNFLRGVKASLQNQAPDSSAISNLLDKLKSTRDATPYPRVADEGLRARSRAARPNQPGNKKGAFSEDENDAIIRGVARHGEGQWAAIKNDSKILSNRTNKQIKDRYTNIKRKRARTQGEPGSSSPRKATRKKRADYTDNEDNAILNGVEKYSGEGYVSWKSILTDPEYRPILEQRNEEGIRKRYEKVLQQKPPAFREL